LQGSQNGQFRQRRSILDICGGCGGLPGDTHTIWYPAVEIDEQGEDKVEGKVVDSLRQTEEDRFMCFSFEQEVIDDKQAAKALTA
jgi:hypothetical protein